MDFAICSPAELYQNLHFVKQVEGCVRGMFPRDGKAEKVGPGGKFGELALGSSYSYSFINTNSSVGSSRGQ